MCELTLEAAGIDRDKEEWRKLAKNMRDIAHRSLKMARIAKLDGAVCEAASWLNQARRSRRWANEFARDAK